MVYEISRRKFTQSELTLTLFHLHGHRVQNPDYIDCSYRCICWEKNRYLLDKSTKKTPHQYQRKGFILNTWRRNSSWGGNPRHGGRRSGPSSDCCCLCRSVTVETKTRPHRDTAHFSACLQNCFLNKHFVIIYSTNDMCAFA